MLALEQARSHFFGSAWGKCQERGRVLDGETGGRDRERRGCANDTVFETVYLICIM